MQLSFQTFQASGHFVDTLPVGTTTVESSFSQMKMVKTKLHSRLNDVNLARLMRIVIEADFSEILDIFKETNLHIFVVVMFGV